MPQVDLAAALQPIAAALLPGWKITCEALPAEEMAGALATCLPYPTRSIAHVRVLTPWPEGESLVETLWHELTHAAISPITAQLGNDPGAVMVEEQIVERLGNLLAKIPLAARLAVARAINSFAPAPMRARLSTASAGRVRARSGGVMDPDTIKALIEAIKAQDGEAALAICEKALLDQATGGAAPTAEPGEPAGEEPPAAKVSAGAEPGGADSAPPSESGEPQEGARVVARKKGAPTVIENADQKRARLAREQLEADAAESKIIVADQRKQAKQGLVEGLRARLAGHTGLPAIEKRVLAAPTYERAKELADTAIEMGGGQVRARAVGEDGQPIGTKPAPDTTGTPAPYTAAQLVAEGIPSVLAGEIVEQHKKSPKLAENSLLNARARLNGHGSGFMPAKPAAGAQKGS